MPLEAKQEMGMALVKEIVVRNNSVTTIWHVLQNVQRIRMVHKSKGMVEIKEIVPTLESFAMLQELVIVCIDLRFIFIIKNSVTLYS